MFVADIGVSFPPKNAGALLARVGIALVAIGLVVAGLVAIAYLLLGTGLTAPRPARNPFATGLPMAGPATTNLGALILILQAHFYAAMRAAVEAMKAEHAGVWPLATIGFLYGIFHAAGPGHGKGVISGFIFATNGSIRHGLVLSSAAALLQAAVAIVIVTTYAMMLNLSSAALNSAASRIEMASFAGVTLFGMYLVWAKAGEVLAGAMTNPENDKSDACLVSALAERSDWRVYAGVIVAAGIRPCSGAIILLVFALSQGLFFAGVIGALAMAVGTSITTGSIASLSVMAKSACRRLLVKNLRASILLFSAFEVLAAAFVLVLGATLLSGVWLGGLALRLD